MPKYEFKALYIWYDRENDKDVEIPFEGDIQTMREDIEEAIFDLLLEAAPERAYEVIRHVNTEFLGRKIISLQKAGFSYKKFTCLRKFSKT